jgi:hypothetical protein
MAMPVGTWHIVTNLHCSTLEITAVDPQGKLTGTIKTNTNTPGTHNISGTWDAANLGLGPFFALPLTFTGYFFQEPGQQLFQHAPGSIPPAQTNWNLLAGTFQSTLVIGTPHPNGWVARIG